MAEQNLPIQTSHAADMSLPSGRSVRVSATSAGEQLEILSPDGTLELRVSMTPQGPVLSLSGARLELNATEAVSLNCGSLEINSNHGISMRARGGIEMETGGDFRTVARGNADIDAQLINLNCGDRSQYNDSMIPAIDTPTSPAPESGSGDCGCKH